MSAELSTECTCQKICIVTCTLGTRPTLVENIEAVKLEISNMHAVVPVRHILVVNRSQLDTDDFPIFVSYEPRRGYSYVRNHALELLEANECLIFLDDDTIPQPGWLSNFWVRHAKYPRAMLKGPYVPIWRHQGVQEPLAEHPQYRSDGTAAHKDDQVLATAGIGNTLLGSELVETGFIYFDHFFVAGGEDTDLCMRLAVKGMDTRFVAGAIVQEVQDTVRQNPNWIRSRKQYDRESYSLAGLRNFGLGWTLRRLIVLLVALCLDFLHAVVSKRSRRQSPSRRQEIRAIWTGSLNKAN